MNSEERRGYIGASDAAGVLGLSRWQTPLGVWAEKTGQIEVEDISDKLQVKLGVRLEEVVAELFTEKTGKKVHRVNEAFTHKQYPFLKCHIDRKVEGERAILQCKTASAWKAKEWDGEEIPHEYIIQEMHELAVTGYDRAYIAVLIGNQDFKWKVIDREEAVLADMIAKEVNFWNAFVLTKEMPTVITKRDKGALDALYPVAEDTEIQLEDKANAMIESLQGMKEDARNLGGQIDQQENELKAMLGTAERGNTGIYRVFWTNTKGRIDMEALSKAHPELCEKFRKPHGSRKFTYKEITGGTNG